MKSVDAGTEKVLKENGASFVALGDARKLDYYHTLEEEHASLILLDEAETSLGQAPCRAAYIFARFILGTIRSMTSNASTRVEAAPHFISNL
jgi:hypothetical protein